MAADKNLQALLTDSCQLDVFAVRANTVKDAAESIAQNIASIASGKKSEGKAAMVLADNGYYYKPPPTRTPLPPTRALRRWSMKNSRQVNWKAQISNWNAMSLSRQIGRTA